MIVIPHLRFNDPIVIKRWEEHLEKQKAQIMLEAAQKVAQIDRDFSRLLVLAEQQGRVIGPPPATPGEQLDGER